MSFISDLKYKTCPLCKKLCKQLSKSLHLNTSGKCRHENFEYYYIVNRKDCLILEFTIEEVFCSMRIFRNKLDFFIRKNNKNIKSSYLFIDDNLNNFDLQFVTDLIDKSFKMEAFV